MRAAPWLSRRSEEFPVAHPNENTRSGRNGGHEAHGSLWQRLTSRLSRQELSGSLGDLGTFVPLLVGLSVTNGLDFVSALFFSGLFNIVTGLLFGIPLAVQPMKAIAAIAIDQGSSPPEILAAGICTGAVILLLGVTRLIDWFDRILPLPVVRGLQLGLGLILIGKGIDLMGATHVWWGWDSAAVGLGGVAFALTFMRSSRVPTALILFGFGLLAAVCSHPTVVRDLKTGVHWPALVPITLADFRAGFLNLSIPQIPLTVLNSVIAVCALSVTLFPDRPAKPRPVAVSVGLMNLIGCWFGAMPMCHGAGGLAAQYRFGARTNASMLVLGTVKMLLAVLLGGSLLTLLQIYPMSVLGVLLSIGGLELAVAARDQTDYEPAMIMLVTAGATIAFKSTALGFAFGWALALLLTLTGMARTGGR
jgi:MFS superfamily sulfate permease-like transporter